MNALAGVRTSTFFWVGVGPIVSDGPAEFVFGLGMAAVFSYLPDIEHPESTAGKAIGKMPSGLVRKISGGHRMLTHSLFFALLAGFLTWWVLDGDRLWSSLQWLARAQALDISWGHFGSFLGLVPTPVFGAMVGVLAHIWCDLLTVQGTGLFSPFSRKRVRLANFRTGSRSEEFYLTAVNVATAIFVMYHLNSKIGVIQ